MSSRHLGRSARAALVTLVLLLPVAAVTSAHAAAPLTLDCGDLLLPRMARDYIDPDDGGYSRVYCYVNGPVGARAHLDYAADGTTLDPSGDDVTVGSHGTGFSDVELQEPEPGLHRLTVTMRDDDGAVVATAVLPHLFTPTTELVVERTGSLAGRSFSTSEYYNVAEQTYLRAELDVWFVDGTWAYHGIAPEGRPRCPAAGRGCAHYAYDETSGLVQVGDDIIAQVDDHTAFFVNAGFAEDDSDYDPSPGYAHFTPLASVPARVRARLRGTWTYQAASTLTWARLRFTGDGRFDLRYAIDRNDENYARRLHGWYRFSGADRVVLHYQGGVSTHRRPTTKVISLLARATHDGEPRVRTRGLWMGLRLGDDVDGALLDPAGRAED